MDPDERLADVGWLNEILDAGASWPHGHLASARRERIGVGYGLSGVVHRLHATTTTGREVTLVAKREEAAKIERAITARAHVESAMGRAMPVSYGCHIDERLDDGLILLEDVGPAVQGDELAEVDRAHASQLVAVVAMLHTRTLPVVAASTPMADRWQPTTRPRRSGSIGSIGPQRAIPTSSMSIDGLG